MMCTETQISILLKHLFKQVLRLNLSLLVIKINKRLQQGEEEFKSKLSNIFKLRNTGLKSIS